jgi:MYXO-CTERM domain-containing protein
MSFAMIVAFGSADVADAIVVNFDGLSHDTVLTGTQYAGLGWEMGNVGVGGVNGYWLALISRNYPHSAPGNLINAGGCTSIGITFPSAANLSGAYVAVQGDGALIWTTGLRAHGYNSGQEVAVTNWFTTISTTPEWFDMSALTNVDRIVFESVPVYENTGYYGLDDLTFTYVPEPAGISLGLLSLGGLLLRRRRRH